MGARERPVACVTGLAVGVERVFDDVVTGRAGDMDKELAGKLAEPELLAYSAAVDRNRTALAAAALSPFGDHLAVAVEQRQPAGHIGRAVARPIIRGHEARMQRGGVAKQRKVGREVERV